MTVFGRSARLLLASLLILTIVTAAGSPLTPFMSIKTASASSPVETLYSWCPKGDLYPTAAPGIAYCNGFSSPGGREQFVGTYSGTLTMGPLIVVNIFLVGVGNVTLVTISLKDTTTGQTLATGSYNQRTAVAASDCARAVQVTFTAQAHEGEKVSSGDGLNFTEAFTLQSPRPTITSRAATCSSPDQTGGFLNASGTTPGTTTGSASTNSTGVSSSSTGAPSPLGSTTTQVVVLVGGAIGLGVVLTYYWDKRRKGKSPEEK